MYAYIYVHIRNKYDSVNSMQIIQYNIIKNMYGVANYK